MDQEQLSQIVVEVIKQLHPHYINDQKKKVLILLEGCTRELYLLKWIKMEFQEYECTFFLNNSMEEFSSNLKNYGRVMVREQCDRNIEELLQDYDVYVILSPSIKMISRLAHIIIDDLLIEIVYEALLANKKVKMISLEENKRLNCLPEALKKEVQQFIYKIETYGVEIVSCFSAYDTNEQQEQESAGRLLSLEKVIKMTKEKKDILIDSTTIVTPLAAEYIKDHHIYLHKN